MTPARADPALRSRVCDAASGAIDNAEFRNVVLGAIRDRVWFDGACLCPVDPALPVPTAVTAIGFDDAPKAAQLAIELDFGSIPDVNSFESLMRRPLGIRTIAEATGGKVRDSRPYAELLAPLGMRDEVRMALRGRDGTCWGVCDLLRGRGPGFNDDEVELLAGVLRDIGDGMRTTLLRQAPRVLPAVSGGPAVAIVGADNEFESVTPAVLDRFERLGWSPDGPGRVSPAIAAAVRLRNSGADCIVLRTRSPDGEWVVVRAGRLDGRGPAARVVVTLERAHLPEIVSLVAAARGLTPRETAVLEQVLAGRTCEEIGRRLYISPYTVQDHLKSIFAKTGVNSRRSLVAQLVYTEYLPRVGSEVGPDGWFAGSRAEAAGVTPG